MELVLMAASCGSALLQRIKAVILAEPDLVAQVIADRCGCSKTTVSLARSQLGLRKWRWARRQHVTALQDVDKGLPRCEWCGLLKPCTCTGPRSAVEYMGRRGEPRISSGGL